ncbi:MAG TPA: helix-turn-helix domain-containing protein [Sphingomicrobium sp.]|nr:helix-turn-helix domain-containing protein [Sphingomicrobium sp.]
MNDGTATPARLSRAESKENTHRLLLDAAERVFVRLGYQGATLDGIAAEAGFTKGAVYWHFRNKEALFLELLADGMKRNAGAAEQILNLLAEKPERLDDALGEWFDQFDANSNVPLLGLEMDMESRRNPSFAALLDQVVGRQRKTVSRILARYFEVVERDPPIPVDELAGTMIALAKTVALARQTRHSATLTSAKAVRILLGMPVTS